MEILSPSPPLSPGPGPAPAMDRFLYGGCGSLHAAADHMDARVHVAIGRSPEKTLALLRWTFRRFACAHVALLHVHRPSPVIPTLLGKIPAAQATEELVVSHRKSEKDAMNKILHAYLSFCHRAQVQASLLVTENEQIHDGIVTLVRDHGITRLVMGSTPDSCFKLKASYSKASFIARNAPAFCEIWFVWRGRHIWTKEASAAVDSSSISAYNQDDVVTRKWTRLSSYSNNPESILDDGYFRSGISTIADIYEGTVSHNGRSNDYEVLGADTNHFYNMDTTILQDAESVLDSAFLPGSFLHMETLHLHSKELLHANFEQIMIEAERSRKEAFAELLKRKETESQVVNTFARAKASDSAKKQEINTREELECLLVATGKQHEDLAENKEKATIRLDSSMRRLAILDERAKNIALWMDEAVAEMEMIHSSIETLRQERPKTENLGDIHIGQDEGCTNSQAKLPNSSSFSLADDSYIIRELTFLDVQAATCKFSESFKIRSQGHGCVYKGEIMNRSVMIYKLHSHSVQSLMQFQREVYILSKVKHPHLVTLVGACPEALCLVYEYLQKGNLHDLLFRKFNKQQLPWKIRARIVSEISSALLFLHSCKPHMIIHGDLKLENILLDTALHSKIADFSICQLFTEDMKDYPAFHAASELKGSFPYADPEYQRTKLLTPKSDIYSFGIVILQLLTGKQPAGLSSEVRRAMSCGKLSSVLDPTAGEWPLEVARRLAEFGLACSEASSRDRADLTPETVHGLEQLHLVGERQVPSSFLCPILQELMNDPQVGADGFTYEGQAIREWMENGRETSPVTNLKLKHLNLIPNHALRSAIQDWLSLARCPRPP